MPVAQIFSEVFGVPYTQNLQNQTFTAYQWYNDQDVFESFEKLAEKIKNSPTFIKANKKAIIEDFMSFGEHSLAQLITSNYSNFENLYDFYITDSVREALYWIRERGDSITDKGVVELKNALIEAFPDDNPFTDDRYGEIVDVETLAEAVEEWAEDIHGFDNSPKIASKKFIKRYVFGVLEYGQHVRDMIMGGPRFEVNKYMKNRIAEWVHQQLRTTGDIPVLVLLDFFYESGYVHTNHGAVEVNGDFVNDHIGIAHIPLTFNDLVFLAAISDIVES